MLKRSSFFLQDLQSGKGVLLQHFICFFVLLIFFSCFFFLFFSRVLRDSTPRFVGPSVSPSVHPSHFTFSAFFSFLALLLLPKCSGDLKYGPCPPARDWGSRVSGLVFITAPAQPFRTNGRASFWMRLKHLK